MSVCRHCETCLKAFLCVCVCVCVCVCPHVYTKCNHTCVQAINSNHSRNPSIARESIQKIMLFQFKGCEENERERSNKLGLPPTGIYLALRKTFAFSAFYVNSISVTHWQNNDNTLKKYCSVWVNLIRLSYARTRIWEKVSACGVAVPEVLRSQRSFL